MITVKPSDETSKVDIPVSRNRQLLILLCVYVLLRLVLLLASLVAQKLTHSPSLLSAFVAWDGHWYVHVAKEWYGNRSTIAPTSRYSAGGFEPGWPAIIKIGSYLGVGFTGSAFLMSLIVGAITVYALWSLSVELVGSKYSLLSTVSVVVFPGAAVVFGIAYSEVLSIGCVAFTLLFTLKKKWLWASLFGLTAAATSSMAIVVLVPCLFEVFMAVKAHKNYRSIVTLLVIPLGFIGFVAYLAYLSKDLFYWWQLQGRAWGAKIDPLYLFHWFVSFSGSSWGMYWIALAGLVVVFLLVILSLSSNLPVSVKAYIVATVLMMLINPALGPKPRFIFWLFPALFLIPVKLRKDWFGLVVVLCAWLLPLLFIAYTALGNSVAQP